MEVSRRRADDDARPPLQGPLDFLEHFLRDFRADGGREEMLRQIGVRISTDGIHENLHRRHDHLEDDVFRRRLARAQIPDDAKRPLAIRIQNGFVIGGDRRVQIDRLINHAPAPRLRRSDA
jgi:hypothetical protein